METALQLRLRRSNIRSGNNNKEIIGYNFAHNNIFISNIYGRFSQVYLFPIFMDALVRYKLKL